ncbi:MAG: type II toxin-antitoxin system VapC family toxin [Balneolaceae bacterium]
MAQLVIVDTDILIDFGLDEDNAVKAMAILESNYQLATSVITVMELYSGCRSKKDLKRVDELITDIQIQFVSTVVSTKAFELMKKFRSSHGVEINDMLIAATTIEAGAKMISKNQKHYQFIPSLDLLEYPLGEV